METESSNLTASDRLCWTGLIIFIVLWTFVGVTAALYIQQTYLGGTAATDSGQWIQVVFFVLLIAGATAFGGLLSRLIVRRLVSLQTQKRWLESLREVQNSPYAYVRNRAAVVTFFIWVSVPDRDAL